MNTNRQRGDYLERQTREALRAHGWIVIRAAGSLGVADLVALRRSFTPLLISCKTNGRISPAERTAIREAATQSDARALVACRTRRGYVDLHTVTADGLSDRIDQIKVPPRAKAGTGDLEVDSDDSGDDDE